MANYVELGYDGDLSMAEIIAAAKEENEDHESDEKDGE